MEECTNCNECATHICGDCGIFAYCGKECQRENWEEIHNEICFDCADPDLEHIADVVQLIVNHNDETDPAYIEGEELIYSLLEHGEGIGEAISFIKQELPTLDFDLIGAEYWNNLDDEHIADLVQSVIECPDISDSTYLEGKEIVNSILDHGERIGDAILFIQNEVPVMEFDLIGAKKNANRPKKKKKEKKVSTKTKTKTMHSSTKTDANTGHTTSFSTSTSTKTSSKEKSKRGGTKKRGTKKKKDKKKAAAAPAKEAQQPNPRRRGGVIARTVKKIVGAK